MDLIPSPAQVVAALGNAAQIIQGGVADLEPTPRTLIYDGPHHRVYAFTPESGPTPTGEPVLLVAPPTTSTRVFDLRGDLSLAATLTGQGRPTYVIEYADTSVRDRSLHLDHWLDAVLPAAVERVAEHAGRPVHLVGWSLGGVLAVLTAADRPTLPLASVVALGAAFDLAEVPLMAPTRPLANVAPGSLSFSRAFGFFGERPPAFLLPWALGLAAVQRLIDRPLAVLANLDDTDFLAQIEAVDAFVADTTAYPGRAFGQSFHRFLPQNELAGGSLDLSGRRVSLADVRAPVLLIAGSDDEIAPLSAVRPATALLNGASEARLEIVAGGHLGLITGRQAREGTWPVLAEWFADWTGRTDAPANLSARATDKRPTTKKTIARKAAAKKTAAKKPAAKRAPAKKTAAKKTPAKKTAAKKPAAKKTAAKTPAKKASTKKAAAKKPATASRESIGANVKRRYGSQGSRALAK